VSVVSKSSKIHRIQENSQIFDFELSAKEVN
jgi:diketogulonate reductase-like aldo/keto reductase